MRSKGTWIATAVALFLALCTVPLNAAGASGRGGVDDDGNKIFDSLDDALDDAPSGRRLDVIALFAGGSAHDRADDAHGDVGPFRTTYEYDTLPAFAAQMTPGQIRALARRPDVVHVQADSEVDLALDTAKAAAGADRAALDFGVDGNNESSAQCPGIRQYCKDDLVVAVLDSGVDVAHADLDGGKVLGGTDCSSGACSGSMWMVDTSGHGTHVSSIVAGEGDGDAAMKGVAPGAALVSVRVGSTGSTVSALDASLEWVLANQSTYGIEIVNMSLNGKVPSDGTDTTSRLTNRLAASGVTTFAAMGNGAPDPGTVSFPAAAKYAVGVGNMADPGDDDGGEAAGFALWWMSKRGPTADGRVKPDLLSYGVDVMAASANTGNGYKTASGTSQATPLAAGVAALMLDANPLLAPSGTACARDDLVGDCADGVVDASMSTGVKDALLGTAVDWSRPGPDNESGAGRLDAYAAVDAASASAPVGSARTAGPEHAFVEGTLAAGGVADHTFQVTSTNAPIAATVIMVDRPAGATTPDFDLALLSPSGQQIAFSAVASDLRQETVSAYPLVTGTYTARVISASGGGTYWLDLSYPGSSTPAPTPTPTPSPTPTPTPTPPPAAPAGLTAVAVTGSTSQINLTWGDVAGESGFKVERSGDGISGWTQIATTAANTPTYRDSGLAMSTTYYYRVKAYSAAGDSAPSNTASGRTNGDTTAPSVPGGLKATASKGKVTVTWNASTDAGGSGLAGYKVFRALATNGPFTQIGTTTASVRTYSDTAVTKGTTYYYYVVAYDNAGNNSAASAKVTGKPT